MALLVKAVVGWLANSATSWWKIPGFGSKKVQSW